MKLTRRGLQRDHGETLIFKEEKIEIRSSYNHIWFSATGNDSSGNNYFYTLELTYEDLAKIIESLEIRNHNDNSINEPLRKAISNKTKPLFRLLMLSSDLLEDTASDGNTE